MRANRRPLFWTAAVALTLALPATARAQQPLDPVKVSARTAEAERLDARAALLESSNARRDWGRAAGLREKAAGLRSAADPLAFKSLQTAALIRHALNQRTDALHLMRRAADQALARGDVFNAAAAYANAAFLAAELRDADRAQASMEQSLLLAQSPLLTAPQREWLLQRVGQGGAATRALAVAPALP